MCISNLPARRMSGSPGAAVSTILCPGCSNRKRGLHMRTLFATIFCFTAAFGFCQRGPTPYYEDTNNIPKSPEVQADRKVTFRLFAPKASDVMLMGSPGILEVIKKPMPLQKDEKGR